MTITEIKIIMVLAKQSLNSGMPWSKGILISKKLFCHSKRETNTELVNEIWRQKTIGKKQMSAGKNLESTNFLM